MRIIPAFTGFAGAGGASVTISGGMARNKLAEIAAVRGRGKSAPWRSKFAIEDFSAAGEAEEVRLRLRQPSLLYAW